MKVLAGDSPTRSHETGGVTEIVAAFGLQAGGDDLPDSVRRAAERIVVDTVACAVAAHGLLLNPMVRWLRDDTLTAGTARGSG